MGHASFAIGNCNCFGFREGRGLTERQSYAGTAEGLGPASCQGAMGREDEAGTELCGHGRAHRMAAERFCPSWRPAARMKIPIRNYLAAVLPGIADVSIQRLAQLTPSAWAALQQ